MIRRPPRSTLFPYTDALPISFGYFWDKTNTANGLGARNHCWPAEKVPRVGSPRSEEHTSELQSRQYLVCRLLLEKKKREHADSADPRSDTDRCSPVGTSS